MVRDSGSAILQAVSERILTRYLETAGYDEVERVGRAAGASNTVDLTYQSSGRTLRVKVKPDPYFGLDVAKFGNRELSLYRPAGTTYALEVIADARTREPGWALRSDADELFYYSVAIPQAEGEVAELLDEPDATFFTGLKVERDELRVFPMLETRSWFQGVYEDYPSRPVVSADYSAWYRLVPRSDMDGAVPGAKSVSPVFATLWP